MRCRGREGRARARPRRAGRASHRRGRADRGEGERDRGDHSGEGLNDRRSRTGPRNRDHRADGGGIGPGVLPGRRAGTEGRPRDMGAFRLDRRGRPTGGETPRPEGSSRGTEPLEPSRGTEEISRTSVCRGWTRRHPGCGVGGRPLVASRPVKLGPNHAALGDGADGSRGAHGWIRGTGILCRPSPRPELTTSVRSCSPVVPTRPPPSPGCRGVVVPEPCAYRRSIGRVVRSSSRPVWLGARACASRPRRAESGTHSPRRRLNRVHCTISASSYEA